MVNYLSEMPFAIAHRGGNERYPENTLEAFTDALAVGYMRLETDVHVGSDGDVLAVHGLTIDGKESDQGGDYVHVNGAVISISGLTRANRKAMKTDGINIPTLNEVLDLGDAYWNIDAKTPAAVAPLLKIIEARNLFSVVCLGSFDPSSIQELRRNSPVGTQTALVESELIELYMASLVPGGIANLPENTRAQVPTTFQGIPVTTPEFINTAHRHKIPVEAWTINEAAEMNALIDLGIDGIFTDKLRILDSVLATRTM